jgi:pimeloyl-ACP methyl ester carboxylesterase
MKTLVKFIKQLSILVLFTLIFSSTSFAQSNLSSITVEIKGAGKPILLLPGLMSDASVWLESAEVLSKQHELHLVSVAGFAGQAPIDDISLVKLQQDLVSYIRINKLAELTIIGHSMGAFLGYYLALELPDNVGKVIAIDGLPFVSPIFTRTNKTKPSDAKPYAQQIKTQYQSLTRQQMAAMTKQGIFTQATSAQDQAKVIEMAKHSDPKTVGTLMHDLMITDLRDSLKNLKVPVLVLGASGAFRSEAEHEYAENLYQAQFSLTKLVELRMNRNVRHFIMFDDLPWLLTQINQFI